MRVLKPRTEPRSRQEVEEQRTFGLGGQRDHLALLLVRSFLVDHLQIRGLAAESGAIVDDLAVDLAGCEVDETQGFPQGAGIPLRGGAHTNVLMEARGFYIIRRVSTAGYSGDPRGPAAKDTPRKLLTALGN